MLNDFIEKQRVRLAYIETSHINIPEDRSPEWTQFKTSSVSPYIAEGMMKQNKTNKIQKPISANHS